MIFQADLLQAMSFNAQNQEDATWRRQCSPASSWRRIQAASDETAPKNEPSQSGWGSPADWGGAARPVFVPWKHRANLQKV
jgi:hypothetical protein